MAWFIVVDTSVFVSALRSPLDSNREVLRSCLRGQCLPLMGTSLFLEFEDVMARASLFQDCPVRAEDRRVLFEAFLSVCHWTQVYYLWRPNLPDEADNHVFELAIAGGANAVVTNNTRHFQAGELRFPEVRILKPHQLVLEL